MRADPARLVEVEAELSTRVAELHAARRAEQAAARSVTALAQVAVAPAAVGTVEELTQVVVREGLEALGARGGAVAVRDADGVRLSMDRLGERAPVAYAQLTSGDALPATTAAVTSDRTFLADLAAREAYGRGMREAAAITGCQAWAVVPLLGDGGTPTGSLSVGYTEPQTFTPRQVELLDAVAVQCTQALQRVRARQAEHERAEQAVATSVTLQRAMLTELPQPDHLQLHAVYVPAADTEQVGGDWYDAVVMPDGSTTLVIGDVVGHDIAAAAAMGQLRSMTRTVAWASGEPAARVLTQVDQAVAGLRTAAMATAVVARIERSGSADAGLRRLRWSSAGHPAPLLVLADGTSQLLAGHSDPLLGCVPGTARHDHLDDLPPGSTLLLFTDGLVERRDRTLADGLEALRASAAAHVALELTALVDAVLHDLVHTDAAARDPRTSDDVAVPAVRLHPEDRPRPPEAGPDHP